MLPHLVTIVVFVIADNNSLASGSADKPPRRAPTDQEESDWDSIDENRQKARYSRTATVEHRPVPGLSTGDTSRRSRRDSYGTPSSPPLPYDPPRYPPECSDNWQTPREPHRDLRSRLNKREASSSLPRLIRIDRVPPRNEEGPNHRAGPSHQAGPSRSSGSKPHRRANALTTPQRRARAKATATENWVLARNRRDLLVLVGKHPNGNPDSHFLNGLIVDILRTRYRLANGREPPPRTNLFRTPIAPPRLPDRIPEIPVLATKATFNETCINPCCQLLLEAGVVKLQESLPAPNHQVQPPIPVQANARNGRFEDSFQSPASSLSFAEPLPLPLHFRRLKEQFAQQQREFERFERALTAGQRDSRSLSSSSGQSLSSHAVVIERRNNFRLQYEVPLSLTAHELDQLAESASSAPSYPVHRQLQLASEIHVPQNRSRLIDRPVIPVPHYRTSPARVYTPPPRTPISVRTYKERGRPSATVTSQDSLDQPSTSGVGSVSTDSLASSASAANRSKNSTINPFKQRFGDALNGNSSAPEPHPK